MSNIAKLNATRAKIAALTLLLPALELAASKEVDPAKVVPGATVTIEYGRGDSRKELVGVITARKEADPLVKTSYAQVKVRVGEAGAFDEEFKVVPVGSVIKIHGDEVETEQEAGPTEYSLG